MMKIKLFKYFIFVIPTFSLYGMQQVLPPSKIPSAVKKELTWIENLNEARGLLSPTGMSDLQKLAEFTKSVQFSSLLKVKESNDNHAMAVIVTSDDELATIFGSQVNDSYKLIQRFLESYVHKIPGLVQPDIYLLTLKTNDHSRLATLLAELEKKKTNSKFILIGYKNNADTINQALQKINKEIMVDTLLYMQSPIYEWYWSTVYRGYYPTPTKTPKNFRRLYNFYSKESLPVSRLNATIYPDRKYRQQPTIKNDALLMPVKNIATTIIDTGGNITPFPVKELLTSSFLCHLSNLIDNVEHYHLNFDLLALVYNKKMHDQFSKSKTEIFHGEEFALVENNKSCLMASPPLVLINRYVQYSGEGLTIQYGDDTGQKYTVLDRSNVDRLLPSLKRSFQEEFDRSNQILFNLLQSPATGAWLYGGQDKDIQRLQEQSREISTNLLYEISPISLPAKLTKNIEELQKNYTQWYGKELPINSNEIKKHILCGSSIAQGLLEGKQIASDQPTYLSMIISFIWFLYAISLEKNQMFEEGTFVIQDSNGAVYEFLSGYVKKFNQSIQGTIADLANTISYNPFGYSRESSHYPMTKHTFRHYGIDIRFGPSGLALPLLPAQKRHIMFGKIDETSKLLFVKPENFGLYAHDGFSAHALEFVQAQVIKTIPQLAKVGFDVTQYVTTDDAPRYRKERVPIKFIEEFSSFINLSSLSEQDKTSHISNAVKRGIKYLFDKQIDQYFANNGQLKDLREKYKKEYDHLEFRTGREVIITQHEIKNLITNLEGYKGGLTCTFIISPTSIVSSAVAAAAAAAAAIKKPPTDTN